MSSRAGREAQEWAEKRRRQVERAKAIRMERLARAGVSSDPRLPVEDSPSGNNSNNNNDNSNNNNSGHTQGGATSGGGFGGDHASARDPHRQAYRPGSGTRPGSGGRPSSRPGSAQYSPQPPFAVDEEVAAAAQASGQSLSRAFESSGENSEGGGYPGQDASARLPQGSRSGSGGGNATGGGGGGGPGGGGGGGGGGGHFHTNPPPGADMFSQKRPARAPSPVNHPITVVRSLRSGNQLPNSSPPSGASAGDGGGGETAHGPLVPPDLLGAIFDLDDRSAKRVLLQVAHSGCCASFARVLSQAVRSTLLSTSSSSLLAAQGGANAGSAAGASGFGGDGNGDVHTSGDSARSPEDGHARGGGRAPRHSKGGAAGAKKKGGPRARPQWDASGPDELHTEDGGADDAAPESSVHGSTGSARGAGKRCGPRARPQWDASGPEEPHSEHGPDHGGPAESVHGSAGGPRGARKKGGPRARPQWNSSGPDDDAVAEQEERASPPAGGRGNSSFDETPLPTQQQKRAAAKERTTGKKPPLPDLPPQKAAPAPAPAQGGFPGNGGGYDISGDGADDVGGGGFGGGFGGGGGGGGGGAGGGGAGGGFPGGPGGYTDFDEMPIKGGAGSGGMPPGGADMGGAGAGPISLTPCGICGRKFASDRLPKHQAACQKANAKKRKVFDPTKHRTEGTEMAAYVAKGAAGASGAGGGKSRAGRSGQDKAVPAKKSNWRHQHEQFVANIRAAREYSRAVKQGKEPPPPVASTPDPSLVGCQYCGRKFAKETAERHIPRCKNTINRPRPPGAVSARGGIGRKR